MRKIFGILLFLLSSQLFAQLHMNNVYSSPGGRFQINFDMTAQPNYDREDRERAREAQKKAYEAEEDRKKVFRDEYRCKMEAQGEQTIAGLRSHADQVRKEAAVYGSPEDVREQADLLQRFIQKRSAVKEFLSQNGMLEERQQYVDYASESMKASREFYKNKEYEESDFASVLADTFLDLATSMAPGISWGRDVYEAISGVDLLSGEELGTFARSMAVVGVVTAGYGSKIGKALKVVNKLMKGEKAAEVLKTSEKILDSANTIRGKLSNTGPVIPNTTIPKYFNLETAGVKFHVNPNGTKHMGEYITSLPPTHGFPLRNDLLLGSFEGAIKDAVTSGAWQHSLESNIPIISGGWELIFSKRSSDILPVIKHALMKK